MLRRRMTHDGPQAMNRPLDFEEVVEHRNLACGRYTMCLEVVVRRKWPGFTCRLCSLWQRRHPCKETGSPGQIIYLPAVGQR